MTKNVRQRSIQVYTGWMGLEQPALMGTFHATQARGKKCFRLSILLQSGNVQSLLARGVKVK